MKAPALPAPAAFLALAFCLAPLPVPAAGDLVVIDPRVEYRRDAPGLDTPAPRLSWALAPRRAAARNLVSTGYHLRVARDRKTLERGDADLWDSGEVSATGAREVAYAGRPLNPGDAGWWSVRVRDGDGGWSSWSAPQTWIMGPRAESDWSAEWIGTAASFQRGPGSPPPDTVPADPWFRRDLDLDRVPVRVLAHVASVGYHELWINGRKAGDAVLQPSVTDHSKRARYDTYDITSLFRTGPNALGLWLGSGWSIFPKFATADKPRSPIVRAQFEFTFADGSRQTVGTDTTWRTRPSPNRLLGVWDFMHFGGEEQDGARENEAWSVPGVASADWRAPAVVRPALVVSADPVEPNRRLARVTPISVGEFSTGVYRVDFGRNFAGQIELDVRGGKPGDRVEVQFSEQADRPMTHRLRSVYVVGPSGEGIFRQRFNYGVGRWLTIRGLRQAPRLKDVRGWLVRTDYEAASSFDCSDASFNRIWEVSNWTFENLSLGGYLVDCPHRERMGYGGDAHASTTSGLMNYRLGALYTKWAEDWRDAQGRTSSWGGGADAAAGSVEAGALPYTAPTYWGGGGPGWCGFVVHLPWEMWRVNGDRQLLERMLPTLQGWLAFLETRQREDLLRRWGGEWDFLGDWLWPGAKGVNGDTRETLCFNNAYWIYNLQIAARIATVLGRADLAANYDRRAEAVRRAVHREFYDPATGAYAGGMMAVQALALVAQVPPAGARNAAWRWLEDEIRVRRDGHIHAGITGGAFLFKALREAGRDDLIALMVGREGYPGWRDMLHQGATTFWESWENNPDLSYLHSSYLYVGAWFIEGVLGIQPVAETGGCAEVVIRPAPLDRPGLDWARGHFDSPRGRIASAWRREVDGDFRLDLTLPPDVRARVYLPAGSEGVVREGGRQVVGRSGAAGLERDGDRVVVVTGSGSYRFESKAALGKRASVH